MKVTAICPTYNRRQYVPCMLACFLSQTLVDSELIVVDDGTDSIADLIPDNPRIKYIRLPIDSERRLSTGVKRNIACEQAQGEFIVHFDDDDWSAPGRLENQVSEIERANKQVLSYHNIPYWNVDTRKLYRFHPVCMNIPHGASFCYRRDWWLTHKFEDNCLEDTVFGNAATREGQSIFSDAEKFMVVRAHNDNHCITARSMGCKDVPLVRLKDIPLAPLHELPFGLLDMIPEPRATAVCPTYNRRQYIPSMLACFLSQTLTDSELIIVDDGTDSIADLIPENPRIKYIRLEGPRRTTGLKHNIACEQARGEFIVHLDDDDWSAPGRIAHQVSELENSEKQMLTYHNILYLNVLTHRVYRYHPGYRGTTYGATLCYRKAWWEQHQFEDIMIGEDTNFGTVAMLAGQFAWADAKQYIVVRAHGSNTSSTSQWMGEEDIPAVRGEEVPLDFLATVPVLERFVLSPPPPPPPKRAVRRPPRPGR
jgi:glycosyltransferase involved in cell wall biosynthesis